MEPIAFCSRCRGMRVGCNRRYILHCLTCKEIVYRPAKLFILTLILSSFIFAFPVNTGILLSDLDPVPQTSANPVAEASLAPALDPAVHNIDHLLSLYGVGDEHRGRVATAIVETSRKHNIDAKLVASIVIVESRANPFAISDSNSIGIMQIHLSTWGATADEEDINLFKVEDNIVFGVRILKSYVAQYGLWPGVMRYKGWTDTPESRQKADDYVQKIKQIYQPSPKMG